MDEEVLARILKKVITDEELAKAADLVDTRNDIKRRDETILGIDAKLEALEKRLEEISAAPKRTSTGNWATTSASGPSQGSTTWVPRLIHCLDFAPYGCGPGDKLRKQGLGQT